MEASPQINSLSKVKYSDLPIRILLSCIAGYWIMRIDRFEPVQTTIERKGYTAGLLVSIVIALVVTSLIRELTLKLDKANAWENDFWKRFWLQVGKGIFAGLGAAFFLIALYYQFLKHDSPLKWFDRYGDHVLLMITLLNAYYMIYYFYVRFVDKKNNLAATLAPTILSTATVEEVVPPLIEEVKPTVSEDPIELAVVRKGFLKMKYWSGRQEPTNLSLDEISNGLSDFEYVTVNRNFIIRRSNVLDVLEKLDGGRVVLSKYPVGGRYEVSARQAHKFDWSKRNNK